MINKAQIQNNLNNLDNLFKRSHSGRLIALWFSKLAILELCGWIEESMDNIVLYDAKRRLKYPHILKIEKAVLHNYSFDYGNNFRKMLKKSLGSANVVILENSLDAEKFLKMKASLGTLKRRRDDLAHTFVKGTTPNIDAPSKTYEHFENVYRGLKHIEKCIRVV